MFWCKWKVVKLILLRSYMYLTLDVRLAECGLVCSFRTC